MTTDSTPLPPWRILEALAVTPVSRTWRVEVGGEFAVLREDEPGARRLGLNRAAEPAVLRAAAAAGLGPACRFADPVAGLLLTDWLRGRALTPAELREPDHLQRAVRLLRRVHATPLATPVAWSLAWPVVDLGAAIDRYAAAAGTSWADLAASAHRQLARAVADGLADGVAEPCCCHNDPTPGNFIAGPSGSLHLIDWEYAGLCHPGFDLAGLALGAALTEEGVDLLLQTYRGRSPTRAETARHREWEGVCASLGELWAAALAAAGTAGV